MGVLVDHLVAGRANRWPGILHGVLEGDCIYDEATAWGVATDLAAWQYGQGWLGGSMGPGVCKP